MDPSPNSTGANQRVLVISDGAGEDWVGVQLALALQKTASCQVMALPLVGEGELYRRQQITVLGRGTWLPSGGFTFKHWQGFWQDLRGGLAGHSWRALHTCRAYAQQVDWILAVGDVLPLALAWCIGKPYFFMGCTKSDYYLSDSETGSCYLWPERWLMDQSRCLYAYTRDEPTAKRLAQLGVRARYFGNPMMDGLALENSYSLPSDPVIGLLPGSRPGETQANFSLLLACTVALNQQATMPLHFVAALAPGLPLTSFWVEGWQWQEPYLVQGTTRVLLKTGAFGEVLKTSQLFLAMAGTATEQAVGLGRPVITLPGLGPQFTLRFAQLQCQLLGESVLLCPTPQEAAATAWHILGNPQRLRTIRQNGLARMGKPGASQAIAQHMSQCLG